LTTPVRVGSLPAEPRPEPPEPLQAIERQGLLIRALRDRVHASEQERLHLERRLERVLRSYSWRLTAPLRGFAEWCRRIVARGSAPAPGLAAARALLGVKAMLRPGLARAFARSRPGRGPHPFRLGPPPGPARPLWDAETVAAAGLRAFLASDARLRFRTSERPDLSVVVVLFNRAELTYDCLRSLAEAAPASFELIVVDNASTDATPRLLERVDGIRLLRNPTNLHFLRAVNAAVEQARGPRLLLLNNDTQVLPGSVESALRTLDSAPDVGAVGAKIVHMDGTLQEAGSILWRDGTSLGYGSGDDPLAAPYMFQRTVDYSSAAFLLTPTRLFRELGGFSEAFQPAYYEDVDYCLRLGERGLRVVYDPQATILHYQSASAASVYEPLELTLAHRPILVERHRELLARQHAPLPENVLSARSSTRGDERTLVIEDRVPHPFLGSGFPRSRLLLQCLLERGHGVTLFPTDVCDEDWSHVYRELPRQVEVMLQLGPDRLADFLRDRRGYYRNIIVSRPHNMERLAPVLVQHPEWFRGTRVIYDAEALYALRRSGGKELAHAELEKRLRHETGLARHADAVASVSERERRLLAAQGVEPVFPLGYAVNARAGSSGFEKRSGLLFVGSIHEETSPNCDAVRWFVEEILPRVSSALGHRVALTVVGFDASATLRRLASSQVRFAGSLADLAAVYDQSRVFVAPNRFGAGIPLKVVEAAAHGLPVVATPLLAEQLGWQDGELATGADAESFAGQCVSLYQSPTAWRELRHRALRRVETDWSRELFDAQLDALLGNPRSSAEPGTRRSSQKATAGQRAGREASPEDRSRFEPAGEDRTRSAARTADRQPRRSRDAQRAHATVSPPSGPNPGAPLLSEKEPRR
jgi:GT2 family glycosyltransferase/glycosyltransferase involved in cell wall biosynthesis